MSENQVHIFSVRFEHDINFDLTVNFHFHPEFNQFSWNEDGVNFSTLFFPCLVDAVIDAFRFANTFGWGHQDTTQVWGVEDTTDLSDAPVDIEAGLVRLAWMIVESFEPAWHALELSWADGE